MAAPKTPRHLRLSVLRGDAEPSHVKVEQDRVLTLGRGRACNVRLTDPLVEFQHARLYWSPEHGSFVVEDLGSSYGTFVDGQPLRSGSVRITLRTQLRLGDTEFEVHGPGRLSTRGRIVLLSVLLLLGLGLLLSQWKAVVPLDTSAPEIALGPIPLTAPQRYLGDRTLRLPPPFLWEHGISSDLSLVHVSETDGFDWAVPILHDEARHRLVVVAFASDGTLLLLGDTPYGRVQPAIGAMPDILAEGIVWRYDSALPSGSYRPVEQTGPVVWYREKLEPDPLETPGAARGLAPRGPLQVRRFAMKGSREQLSLFLSERGVNSPVHYIVCEGAFDGVRFQVLDDEGHAQLMSPACLSALTLVGGDTPLEPIAVALTPSGYYGLLDALVTFYSGEPEGLFLDSETERSVIVPARADPGGYVGNVRLTVKTSMTIPPFSAWPKRPLPAGAEGLLEDDDPTTGKAAPSVQVVPLPYPGMEGAAVDVATNGCTFRVELGPQIQVKRMFQIWPPPFARVWCGEQVVLDAPYATGVTRAKVGPVEIALKVAIDGDRVRSALFGWR